MCFSSFYSHPPQAGVPNQVSREQIVGRVTEQLCHKGEDYMSIIRIDYPAQISLDHCYSIAYCVGLGCSSRVVDLTQRFPMQ